MASGPHFPIHKIKEFAHYGFVQKRFVECQVTDSGYHVTQTILDNGTGKDAFARSGMVNLIETLEKNTNIKDVIVENPTRLSRGNRDVRQIVQKLADMNVRVQYVEEGLGSNSVTAEVVRFIRSEERRSHGERIQRSKQLERGM